jgi:hypothetical protein
VVRDLRADCDEYRVEAALRFFGENVGDPVVAQDLGAHRLDACDLPGDSLARQAIRGDAVSHHPSRLLAAIADLDLMPQPTQMESAGQSRRAGPDHQDALPGRSSRRGRPAFSEREIAKEAIDRVDRHRLIEELSIAGAFAGMVTSASVCRRKRIVLHVFAPGLFVSAGLREG